MSVKQTKTSKQDRELRPGRAWCVFRPSGKPETYTTRTRRRDAIEAFKDDHGPEWDDYVAKGFSVEPVDVVPKGFVARLGRLVPTYRVRMTERPHYTVAHIRALRAFHGCTLKQAVDQSRTDVQGDGLTEQDAERLSDLLAAAGATVVVERE